MSDNRITVHPERHSKETVDDKLPSIKRRDWWNFPFPAIMIACILVPFITLFIAALSFWLVFKFLK